MAVNGAGGDAVEAYDEGRSLKAKDGRWTDNFTAYAVHIYRIGKR